MTMIPSHTKVQFSALATLDDDQLMRIYDQAQCIKIAAQTPLLQEGQCNDALYLVVQGRAVVRKSHRGQVVELGYIGEGELVGEWSLLSGTQVGADVVSDSAMQLYRIPGSLIVELYRSTSSFQRSLDMVCERRLVLSALALNPIFSILPVGLRQSMGYIGDFIQVAVGDALVNEGDRDLRFMYLLLSGETQTTIRIPGEEGVLAISHQGVGDEIGEIALISGHPRVATVRAIQPVKALRLSNKTIHSFRLSNLDFSLALYESTKRKMRQNMQALIPEIGENAARECTLNIVPSFDQFQQPEKHIAPLFE
ncbi:MAG: cyclic nucleotide-binding domain-containing protein [Mariprofundales bacterium]